MNKEVICNFLIESTLVKAPKCYFLFKKNLFLILYNLRHIQLAEAEA